jgi:hypothetical protein
MKRYSVSLAGCLVFLLLCVPSRAGWGSCAFGSSPSSQPSVTWTTFADRPFERYFLTPVRGAYDYEKGLWHAWDGTKYLAPVPSAPFAIPAPDEAMAKALEAKRKPMIEQTPQVEPDVQNFGLDRDGCNRGGYSEQGKPCTRDAVRKAIENQVPDNSKKRQIVVIGEERDRRRALDVIGSPKYAVVTAFAPDHWYVAKNGYVNGGSPTTYILEPDGGVVHRQDDLTGLDRAVFIGDPDYDPKKDPDLRQPPAQPTQPVQPAGPQVEQEPVVCAKDVGFATGGGILGAVLAALLPYLFRYLRANKEERERILIEAAVAAVKEALKKKPTDETP